MTRKIVLALAFVELLALSVWTFRPIFVPPQGFPDGQDARRIRESYSYGNRLVDPYECDASGGLVQMNVKRWVHMETKARAFTVFGSLIASIALGTFLFLLMSMKRSVGQAPTRATMFSHERFSSLVVTMMLLSVLFLVVLSSFMKARHTTAHNYLIDDLRQSDSGKEK
jgi:hypothetical protein